MDITAGRFTRTCAPLSEPQRHRNAFRIAHRTYEHQLYGLYYIRVQKLRPEVQKQAQRRWGTEYRGHKLKSLDKVLDVSNELCYIIGTVYVGVENKPSALGDIAGSHLLADPTGEATDYKNEARTVDIEDESGRVRLAGAHIENQPLVTGMVIAVLGRENKDGHFEVFDMCTSGMPEKMATVKREKRRGRVAIISGLDIWGTEEPDTVSLSMQLLAEFLAGLLGSSGDQQESSNICHLIVAGDLIDLPSAPLGQADDAKVNNREDAQKCLEIIDTYLADIQASVPVTIMPGPKDPSDIAIPQRALNPGLFQKAQERGLASTSNPAWMEIDSVSFLGTAGQNIDDIARYIDADPCKLAAESLGWRHIAPSAPDTLWCYPFVDHDPFILSDCPDIYFIGNQKEFDSLVVSGPQGQKVRVVSIPRFSAAGEVVIVDLNTLECSTVKFGSGLDRKTE